MLYCSYHYAQYLCPRRQQFATEALCSRVFRLAVRCRLIGLTPISISAEYFCLCLNVASIIIKCDD